MRHKHADIIHSWAEGDEIQQYDIRIDGWVDVLHPCFHEGYLYRIKPKTTKREGWVNIGGFYRYGRYAGATIFTSKEDALDNKPTGWVATIKIEWEEEI